MLTSSIESLDTVKVLLVDDEPRNLDALESILDSNGYIVVRAKDADDALFAILQHEFAAIVLDIKMPGTNGLELARLIKQRKRSRHIPILFLSAYSLDEKEILQAYGVGGVDFLSKPINPDILRSKVAVFANLFRTTRALASAVEALNVEVGERENVQEELRQAKDQLESRVLERTTELASANRELMDNEEWLRLALAVAQVATWDWDLQTGKMRWSANPEVLFGFPAGSFGSDSRISHAAHIDDVGVLDAAFQRAMETGSYEVEFRAVRSDGTLVWIAERGRVVQDHERNLPARIVGVSVDLTRRKNLEEALVESDRRKNEFLATLAHELRNPLAPVRYAVKVLDVKGPETPHLRWAVALIDRQIQHMARLIDDLLDVNRISRNMLELRREKVELASVIAVAVETSRPLIEQGNHNLVLDIPADPIYLNADTVRLAQVFSNLLNNATQHSRSPDTGDKIYLTVMREGSSAVIAVKDVGVGIPTEMLPRIFEMFNQGGRLSGGGLGIGLSLARRLVEMHGGSIDAQSGGIGKGATFTVRLPILELSQSEKPKFQNPANASESSTSKRRILVADDNRDVVESFQIMLRILGHEVQTALDGEEAIEKAEQFRPDVIVLDVGMPMLDGYETATRIRQRPWSRDVVLIAVTGWGNDKDKLKSAAAGFDVHLVKPVDATTILEALEQVDQSKAGDSNS
jgi:PAS domain S-box-containing protein